MKIYYSVDSDYIEVFLKTDVENYADFDENDFAVFKSEANEDVIGFAAESFSENIKLFLEKFKGLERLAIIMKVARKKAGLNQEEMAHELGLKLRQYQRIEKGENTKMDVVLKAKERFPKVPFAFVLS